MADQTETLFQGLEILEFATPNAAEPCRRAVATAGRLAQQMGASVWTDGAPEVGPDRAFTLGKQPADDVMLADPSAWAAAAPGRVLLVADVPDGAGAGPEAADSVANVVRVVADPWQNEATLFASSGMPDLFGDPERPPLIPSGHWAAGTVAFAVLGGLVSAHALSRRGDHDVVTVDCIDALRWVNWKSPAMAWAGAPVTREGAEAEWPVLPCADGFAAFVSTARDWKRLVEMVGDPRLTDERFKRYADRRNLRSEYIPILAEWAATKTMAELDDLFHQHAIPAASVVAPSDLLNDPTMVHRQVFSTDDVEGVPVPVQVAPIRVHGVEPDGASEGGVAETAGPSEPGVSEPGASEADGALEPGALPLAGVRVLDLGQLTAGAGSSSLLADMGAEVIKIESSAKPDMFRFWAGSDDSPLFHFSNRSKLGVDLNLKEPEQRAAFLELVAGADAVIENFRRGVLERLDLGFDALRAANPRIVLGSVSGQGLDGPRADHTTFGSTLEALSGFSALTVGPDGVPIVSGANLNFPDQTVCLFAGAVIAAAILKSRAEGTAFHLDVSQRDVAVHACGPVIEQVARGVEPSAWAAQAGAGGRWVTTGADGVTEVAVLDGQGVLDACLADGSSAIVRAPSGDLVKGFPFTFTNRSSTIGGRAPGIGEHNDLVLR